MSRRSQDTTTKREELPERGAGHAADLFQDIAAVLLMAGAHCGRVSRNVARVAEALGYRVDLFISFTGVMVHVQDTRHPELRVMRFHRYSLPGVHFGIVTGVSLLTWEVAEKPLPVDEIKRRMKEIKAIAHHPRSWNLVGIGAACGCLCLLAGGDWRNACIAFVAALSGLFVRQEVLKNRFNPLIAFVAASFVTTLISGMDMLGHFGSSPEKTVATAVLYLVPGVPLINCVIDLIEGYIPTAVARGVFGGLILLCIAVGMSLAITILGFRNF